MATLRASRPAALPCSCSYFVGGAPASRRAPAGAHSALSSCSVRRRRRQRQRDKRTTPAFACVSGPCCCKPPWCVQCAVRGWQLRCGHRRAAPRRRRRPVSSRWTRTGGWRRWRPLPGPARASRRSRQRRCGPPGLRGWVLMQSCVGCASLLGAALPCHWWPSAFHMPCSAPLACRQLTTAACQSGRRGSYSPRVSDGPHQRCMLNWPLLFV